MWGNIEIGDASASEAEHVGKYGVAGVDGLIHRERESANSGHDAIFGRADTHESLANSTAKVTV